VRHEPGFATGAIAPDAVAPEAATPRRSPTIATALSFIWPGLGHAYAAAWRRGGLFAVPTLVIAALVVLLFGGGVERLAIRVLTPSIATSLAALAVLAGGLRVLAMADAIAIVDGRAWRRPATAATFGLLTLVTILIHGSLAWGIVSVHEAGSRIFSGRGPLTTDPGTSPAPTELFPASPVGTPPPPGERVTVLITGIDSEPRRRTNLTDTLIVASIDPATGEPSMISIPRDLARLEFADGRVYRGKINSLMAYAQDHPTEFPEGPLPALMGAIGHLVGVPIPYYAAVNLPGFVKMVDAVGGIDIVNQRAIADPRYGGWTDGRPVGFWLSVGPHHLDGQEALALARSRRGAGDNDFTRARRQQEVLLALRHRLTDPTILPQLPSLISAAGETLRTNFPVERIGEVLDLARAIDDSTVERVVLGPRTYASQPPASETGGVYLLVPILEAIARISVEYYGQDSRYWTPTATPAGSTP
jgi:LCP family protein required for cell wall assembly